MAAPKPAVVIRDLESFDDLKQAEALEREVWKLHDLDVLPITVAVATREAGNLWLGAFDGRKLVGFSFGFFGMEGGRLMVHSHMLAVHEQYQDSDLGFRLKLAQRERVLALRIPEITWTFDPLQSKNAHLNFMKLGVISEKYKIDFYGPQTSSILHRNSTDRFWVRWPLASRRVKQRLEGKDCRAEVLEVLSRLTPLVRFDVSGRPAQTDLASALSRQRIAVEIPSYIAQIEERDPELAREWRRATRWAFSEALQAGFFVAEFCRTVRGNQGPGAYLLEKGPAQDSVPELA